MFNGLGRILRLTESGIEEVARNFRPPLTGLAWRDGCFYVAEGGYPGRILKVSPDGGHRDVLVDNLPTAGDHYTGDIVFGSDGKMYFGVGTATNSGVVGLDNMPWLMVLPQFHDFTCRNMILNGINFESVNIFKPYEPQPTLTGAFKPFGSPSRYGEVVGGQLKCNGVIYCANPDGSDLHIFADGFRNPYGLGFSPDDRLLTIDQGYDYRGSRPVVNSPETLWEVTTIILIPFFLFGKQIETWIGQNLNSSLPKTWVAIMVGLWLTVDILLPIPSSFVSTSAGYLLGFFGGMPVSLVGMSLSSMMGYLIGAHLGRPLVMKLINPEEISRFENIHQRFGDWSIIITRSLPVLAEASVLFAGIHKMPLYRFLVLSTLSNLGISTIYAAVGAYSATANSFLLAFAGAILLPGAAMIIFNRLK